MSNRNANETFGLGPVNFGMFKRKFVKQTCMSIQNGRISLFKRLEKKNEKMLELRTSSLIVIKEEQIKRFEKFIQNYC